MQRREFIRKTSGLVLGYSLSGQGLWSRAGAASSNPIEIVDPNPLQMIPWQKLSSQDFNGDDIERTHEALWNREGYLAQKGGIPAASEQVDTVIVGGGLSGMLAAYYLRDRAPVILEQGVNFGGNSRGEYFEGHGAFSIGGAYITRPDQGSPAETLLTELGLLKWGRAESAQDAKIFYQQSFYQGFWEGETDPAARQQFQQIYQQLQSILRSKYPEIPWSKESDLSEQEWRSLDRMSFWQWLQSQFGSVHPHILEYFQLYCWSSFGGSIDELSAAQALNFIAAETDEIVAFPGGNAAIVQALYNVMIKSAGPRSVRAGHLVLDVTKVGNRVRICYETPDRQLRTIEANHCIMAAPKFVAKRITTDMSPEQQKACDAINYRAYVVANVFVDIQRWRAQSRAFSPCFDLYCLDGEVPETPSALKPPSRFFSDVCFGSWAAGDNSNMGVLTVYKPLPYDGARQFLFSPLSHSKYKSAVLQGVRKLLTSLGVNDTEVKGVRLTRWGHAMPLAEVGAMSSGVLQVASAPIGRQIFFANQDNWANPSFETALEAASRVAEAVRSNR